MLFIFALKTTTTNHMKSNKEEFSKGHDLKPDFSNNGL